MPQKTETFIFGLCLLVIWFGLFWRFFLKLLKRVLDLFTRPVLILLR